LRPEAEARGLTVGGIGVGVPEIVDLAGQVTTGSVIDWTGEDVDGAFAHLGPVTVIADVRAAALAEAQLGAGRGHGVVVYVTVGTGMATVAVFLALGGSSYTVSKGAIGTREIRDDSIRSRDVGDDKLKAKDFAPGQLPSGELGPQGGPGQPGTPGQDDTKLFPTSATPARRTPRASPTGVA
jgi:hypothetical protein